MINSLVIRRFEAPDLGLFLKEDDYSVQVETPSDPMFWIRVERSKSEPVIVSDLKRATLSPDVVGEALHFAVATCGSREPVTCLRFVDIAPGGDEKRIEQEAASLAAVIVEYARLRHQRVLAIEKLRCDSKAHLIVRLGPL